MTKIVFRCCENCGSAEHVSTSTENCPGCGQKYPMSKDPVAVELGRLGGKVSSEAKTRAVRLNGKKGGRPRTYPPCNAYAHLNGSHRFSPYGHCYGCGFKRMSLIQFVKQHK